MTFEEAYKTVSDRLLDTNFSKCIEYKDYFVFLKHKGIMDPSIAVDKQNGKILSYRPDIIPLDEFNSGGKEHKMDESMNTISHSAKGTTWKKKDHKYISKENGVYYYTNKNNKTRQLANTSKSSAYDENGKSVINEIPNDKKDFYHETARRISNDQRLVSRHTQKVLTPKEHKLKQRLETERTLKKDIKKIKKKISPFTNKFIKKGEDFIFYLFN